MLRTLCLLAALAAPAFAGFQNYREPDGLGGSTNRVVFEDREGALWFSGGPTRFDGVHWRVFRKPDGLPGDFCTALGEDADGSMLAVMNDDSILQGTALCRFDGERWS